MDITFDNFLKSNTNNTAVLKDSVLLKLNELVIDKYKTQEKASVSLKISRRFLSMVLKKQRNTSVNFILRICSLLNMKPEEIIEKITPKYNQRGSHIFPEDFPITLNKELASLIGNCFGDGSLTKYFSYSNTCDELIEKNLLVTNSLPIKNLTLNKWNYKGDTLRYSTLVRDVLILSGVSVGNKTKNEFKVPNWILYGKFDIKFSFMRSIFDDEGSVIVDKKEITMTASKIINLEDNLLNYLHELRNMLGDLRIKGVSITKNKENVGKNGKTVSYFLRICGYENFIKFRDKIGFKHPIKRYKLEKMIKNYKKPKG